MRTGRRDGKLSTGPVNRARARMSASFVLPVYFMASLIPVAMLSGCAAPVALPSVQSNQHGGWNCPPEPTGDFAAGQPSALVLRPTILSGFRGDGRKGPGQPAPRKAVPPSRFHPVPTRPVFQPRLAPPLAIPPSKHEMTTEQGVPALPTLTAPQPAPPGHR